MGRRKHVLVISTIVTIFLVSSIFDYSHTSNKNGAYKVNILWRQVLPSNIDALVCTVVGITSSAGLCIDVLVVVRGVWKQWGMLGQVSSKESCSSEESRGLCQLWLLQRGFPASLLWHRVWDSPGCQEHHWSWWCGAGGGGKVIKKC